MRPMPNVILQPSAAEVPMPVLTEGVPKPYILYVNPGVQDSNPDKWTCLHFTGEEGQREA